MEIIKYAFYNSLFLWQSKTSLDCLEIIQELASSPQKDFPLKDLL